MFGNFSSVRLFAAELLRNRSIQQERLSANTLNRKDEIMRALTQNEVQQISGGSVGEQDKPSKMKDDGSVAIGLAGTIGALTFGSGWAGVGVAAAVAASPVAVVAMAGLAAYGAYSFVSSRLH